MSVEHSNSPADEKERDFSADRAWRGRRALQGDRPRRRTGHPLTGLPRQVVLGLKISPSPETSRAPQLKKMRTKGMVLLRVPSLVVLAALVLSSGGFAGELTATGWTDEASIPACK